MTLCDTFEFGVPDECAVVKDETGFSSNGGLNLMYGIFCHLLSEAGRNTVMVSWTKSRGSQPSVLFYR